MQTRAPLVVGRDAELAELERALAGAREAKGGAIFLIGEPGIGKSRLAIEAAGRAFAANMRVLRGRGSTIGPTVPFRPLAEALLSLFRSGDPPADAELGPYKPVLGRLIPDWNEGGAESASLVVLAEAVLRLTGIIGRGRGCLVVLEDLQDADAETLAVLEYLLDNLDTQPTVLVTTIRNEPCGALDLARSAAGRRAGSVLELDRLGPSEIGKLVASCLETSPGQVPAPALERLWAGSAGNPFVVEELLHGMVSTGLLVPGSDGWRVVGEIHTEVPATLVRSIALRADRLGPQGRRLLSTAAVLGNRFPLSVVQQVTGMDDRNLLGHIHAGVAGLLITADEPAPDWYAFQHPLAGEALLAELTPADRADLSRRAADAIEALHPDLPGEWCQLVASLRMYAGDRVAASRRFAEAGRRALADGAAGTAVTLLERASELLAGNEDAAASAEVLETLLYALAEAGRFDRAFELYGALDELGGIGLDQRRRAALRIRLSWVAVVAGRWPEARAELDAARELLGPDAADADTAPLDAAAAELALEAPGRDRHLDEAELLARRAVAAAERAGLPAIACQAWQVVGTIARQRDLDEASACFERARRLAEQHRLPIWRIYALVRLASNDWLAHGDTVSLERARQEALRAGAISLGYVVHGIIAMHTALCGKYGAAAALVDDVWTAVSRLKLTYVARYALMTRATIFAHQGKRREMEAALVEFGRWGGSSETSLTLGLARVFCSLLEEDVARATLELARGLESEEDNPLTFHLAGHHGLNLLLQVLHYDADWARYEEVNSSAVSRMRWNRQFVLLAKAVLLGRSDRGAEASAAVAEALQAASLFVMTQHLGLRLVAEAALQDGWGEPETWLRRAEEYFHQAAIPAVASACRALLRQTGASVRQRRTGTDRVPAHLRAVGITVREYEVFELLVERLGNKAIAGRLHISPRTVEKHVASLIIKTGQPDREALHDYAAATLAKG
jgi:DNA-binding CsgD family transcriptional regulator